MAIAAVFLAAACTGTPSGPTWTTAPSAEPSLPPAATAAPTEAPPAVRSATIYRSPTCGCCKEYETYLETAGWAIESIEIDDTSADKAARGIPEDAWSCHTAVIDGYLVEGHVPMEAIEDLLAERPAIAGIALPGMPAGSPGMGGVKAAPFEVLAIGLDGSLAPFGAY